MTTPVDSYLSVDQLKATLRLKEDTFDTTLALAIASASRQIDEHCRDQFWTDGTVSARVLAPDVPSSIWTGAFVSTAGVIVKTDDDADGVFETTWDPTDWQAEPLAPRPGFPLSRIIAVGTRFFPGARKQPYLGFPYNGYGYGYAGGYMYSGIGYGQSWYGQSRRARVQVTAQWGWPSVPAQVVQACQILAIDHYKSKDLTNGSAGTTGIGTGRFGSQKGLLVSPAGLNPMAVHLLCGLRDVVVA